jgi:hypothetical protein
MPLFSSYRTGNPGCHARSLWFSSKPHPRIRCKTLFQSVAFQQEAQPAASQLHVRPAKQSPEFRAAGYLRAASFSNIPADRSDFAKRVR